MPDEPTKETQEPTKPTVENLDPITKLAAQVDELTKKMNEKDEQIKKQNENMALILETNRRLLGQGNNLPQDQPQKPVVKTYEQIMVDSAVNTMKNIIESG